jgi:hypothetical protein
VALASQVGQPIDVESVPRLVTRINKDEAVLIAKSAAEREDWPWEEPVFVRRERRFVFFGRPSWYVISNSNYLGRNVNVRVDAESGAVISKAFSLR